MAFATKPKPKNSTTHKKRTGAHHKKQSAHYAKHYWPYLPMLMVVIVGLVISAVWQPKQNVLGASSDLSSAALVAATNAQRSAHSETPLGLNDQLSAAAQSKATDMVTRNYWSHTAPDGKSPWYFIVKSGYQYQEAGENLAYGFDDADTAITAWMNSPEHRKNILNQAYRDVGFGVATAPNFVGHGPETVIVAMYGSASPNSTVAGAATEHIDTEAQPVARIQTFAVSSLVGGAFGMTVVMLAAGGIFLIRHARMWHRILVRSEAVVMKHPLFDLAIVSLGVTAYVLSRATAVIM